MSLFKLIHVSDLHFGVGLKPQLAALIKGWEIHDPHVISFFSHAIRDQAQRCEAEELPYKLVCSGDLSTWGTEASIRTATDFLSDCSVAPRVGAPVCLPGVSSPYIPGNHDVWQGQSPLWSPKSPVPLEDRKSLKCYSQLYEQAAPEADRIDGEPFPYRQRLFENSEVVLRLYGLDSTRIDLAPPDELSTLRAALDEVNRHVPLSRELVLWIREQLRWDWSGTDDQLRLAFAAIAVGFVDGGQLIRLQQFVDQERDEFQGRKQRLIRVAMVHHPLAYVETPPHKPAWIPDTLHSLLRLGDVQALLQDLDFSAVLCGHQHRGFLKAVSPDSFRPPLHIFSVGTAGQTVPLTREERRLLRLHDVSQGDGEEGTMGIFTAEEGRMLQVALDKVNEYAVYDLRREADNYFWSCRASRFMPHRQGALIQRRPETVPVSFAL